jgi:hypothetical protein
LRRALEHHGDVPEACLATPVQRVGLFVDDKEVTTLPYPVKSGQLVAVKLFNEQKTYSAGKKIVLSPQV